MISNSTALKPARRKPGETERNGYLSKRDAPVKGKRESSADFYKRLHSALRELQRIEADLPRDVFARFSRAYSQHWLYSLNHGERAALPAAYFNEWAEVEQKGQIPMDTETNHFHGARNYHVYESPRETVRRVLGFED